MAYTVESLMNTSVDDCIISLSSVNDIAMLKDLHAKCLTSGHKTRAHYVKRRIKKLEEVA